MMSQPGRAKLAGVSRWVSRQSSLLWIARASAAAPSRLAAKAGAVAANAVPAASMLRRVSII